MDSNADYTTMDTHYQVNYWELMGYELHVVLLLDACYDMALKVN